ncbi:toll/interleukin-1 receptor domain-containing protein [Salinibacter altiplanensis]|uniref:toll/interleukin-1 receptor domain-containing protein n=1 Tax=Salinibacter altiplanensis TaxID=1803181 RepID=UPI000C9FE206|nr:toll/interleukin-1 receptor domain-containing protein [Salinibacter altiplanensis]
MAVNRARPIQKLGAKLHALQERKKKPSRKTEYREGTPCLFISHKREDTEACKKITDYLLDAGVDVYFDEYDDTLSAIAAAGDENLLTDRITDGINMSTHMLCVVSPQTVDSYWVPFEVGYGYEQTDLGILTLKGIWDSDLPDYMKVMDIVRGIRSLNELIAELFDEPKFRVKQRAEFVKESELNRCLQAMRVL